MWIAYLYSYHIVREIVKTFYKTGTPEIPETIIVTKFKNQEVLQDIPFFFGLLRWNLHD